MYEQSETEGEERGLFEIQIEQRERETERTYKPQSHLVRLADFNVKSLMKCNFMLYTLSI